MPAARCQLRMMLAALAMAGLQAWAWGPHGEIVDAALSVLPAEDGLGERLGADAARLRLLVWMGDWQNSFIPVQETWGIDRKYALADGFYANDYLIFPLAPRYYQHEVPDVRHTYQPFFTRALQALRTETPSNAARWMGSLLHFVTDTGAPPHAAGIQGDVHSRMENWIDGSRIEIRGYRPQLLGSTDEAALRGLSARLTGLIEFSRQRAERLRPLVANNDRAGSEPIVLESAMESARVAADVIHTLLVLSASRPAAPGAQLYATIVAPSVAGLEYLAAKLILLDTAYSTMSEPAAIRPALYRGRFELRNLAPGTYRAVVYRVGCKSIFPPPLELKPGATVRQTWELEAASPAGNLLRNPDFRIRWASKDRPEHWQYNGSKDGWVSDNIRISAGSRYGVAVEPDPSAKVQIRLEWLRREWPQELGNAIPVTAAEMHLAAPAGAAYARLIVAGRELPPGNLHRIALFRE